MLVEDQVGDVGLAPVVVVSHTDQSAGYRGDRLAKAGSATRPRSVIPAAILKIRGSQGVTITAVGGAQRR